MTIYLQETYLSRHMAKHAAADTLPGKHSLMPGLGSPPASASSRAIKQEPMDLADPRDAYHRLLSASSDPHRLLGAGSGSHPIVSHPSNHHSVPTSQHPSPSDRSPPSDLSMNGGSAGAGSGLQGGACSKGGSGGVGPGAGAGAGGPTSAFMPLSPFAANTVSSSGGPGYHYR